MKLIRTTKKMRALYAKHLDMLEDLARGKKMEPDCHMCEAAEVITKGICLECPISYSRTEKDCVERFQLMDKHGKQVDDYRLATPESIRKRKKWIAEQITKFTDCEME